MAVSLLYKNLYEMMDGEIAKGKKIAIFPLGRVGMLARYILENRCHARGIYIDQNLCRSNPDVIGLEKYKEMDNKSFSLILATNDVLLNQTLMQNLGEAGLQADILNMMDHYDSCVEEHMQRIRRLCRVKRVKGFSLTRIGPKHDGGYVMIDDFAERSVAYSIGIASEIGWDMGMIEKGFQIYCFDHTIEQLPMENPDLHFMKIGLGGMTQIGEGLCTLDTMLELNGHKENNKMILKIDIEGAEWDFLEEISQDVLSKFSQITMELHNLLNEDYYEKIVRGLEKINATHQSVWVHANCAGGVRRYGTVTMPDLLEITFANRNEYDFAPCEYHCPSLLDYPNIGEKDIILDGWGSEAVS